ARYQAAHENVIAVAEEIMTRMSEHDHLVHRSGKQMLFRIYRDVRFSKDKSPYKSHFSGRMKRATPYLRGGYYFRLGPGQSMMAGGFFSPNPEDLKRIRTEIADDAMPLREIIAEEHFQAHFGELSGEGVKTAPKGFDKTHPDIDLIRKKQFIARRTFTDKEVLSPDFLDELEDAFLALRPYFDYMSELLTTDGNGQRISYPES
ncbi:MAG: DUF2461 domain-containing protein, partial [Bacteroidota bacterium]